MYKSKLQQELKEVLKQIEEQQIIVEQGKIAENKLSDLTLKESQLELRLAQLEEEEMDYDDHLGTGMDTSESLTDY